MDKKLITKAYETEEHETEETAVFNQTIDAKINPSCYIDPTKYYTEKWVCTANTRDRWQECFINKDGSQRHVMFSYTPNGNFNIGAMAHIDSKGNSIRVYCHDVVNSTAQVRHIMNNVINDFCSRIDNENTIDLRNYQSKLRIAGNNWHIEIYL